MNNRQVHARTIKEWGQVAQVDKVIQEMAELTEKLRDLKIYMFNETSFDKPELKNLFDDILEERCDVQECLVKLDVLLQHRASDIKNMRQYKMTRTLKRLNAC